MKRLIVAVVAVAFGIALAARAYGGTPFSRYRFDAGKNAPKLFYDAYRPIETGSHAEVAIVLIHGWGGHVRTLLPVFTKALAARAGSDERTPYVIAPQFPRHETIASNKEPEDGRAVWCDSWADEDKHPEQMGSASDDWRGGGDADGTSFSSYDYIDAMATLPGFDKERAQQVIEAAKLALNG